MSDIAKYEEQNMFVIRLLAEVGHSDEFICKLLGVHKATWSKWLKDYPDFKRALTNWKKIACGQVEKKVFERAVGYDFESEKIFVNKIKTVRYEEGEKDEDGEVITPPARIESEKVVTTRVPVTEHVPPDIHSAKYFLNNQSGGEWKEKSEVDHGLAGSLADAINRARGRVVEDEDFLK